MRVRGLLAAFLLGVSLCFAPVLGYGEVWMPKMDFSPSETQAFKQDFINDPLKALSLYAKTNLPTQLDFFLLQAAIRYMMRNFSIQNLLTIKSVYFEYDGFGEYQSIHKLPQEVETKGKVCITVGDVGGEFSEKSGVGLTEGFKKSLDIIYTYIELLVTDMDNDVVAVFYSKGDIPVGYFYQGEYHLWEK